MCSWLLNDILSGRLCQICTNGSCDLLCDVNYGVVSSNRISIKCRNCVYRAVSELRVDGLWTRQSGGVVCVCVDEQRPDVCTYREMLIA